MKTNLTWRKSSFSNAQSACVEAAHDAGRVGIRDSKNPAGPRLSLPASAFDSFTGVVAASELDQA